MEGGQGDHLACHILADLFLEFGNWRLLDDIFSSYMFHVRSISIVFNLRLSLLGFQFFRPNNYFNKLLNIITFVLDVRPSADLSMTVL